MNSLPCVKLHPICLAIVVTCILLFLVGPIAIAITVLIHARLEMGIPVALGAVIFVGVLGYAMSSSCRT